MTVDSYRKTAKRYDLFVEPFIKQLRATSMKMVPCIAENLVLDIGCGTGTHLDFYQKSGCKVFGIDSSPAMIDIARTKLDERAELQLGDAAQLPYSDAIFDRVVVFFALHEMPGLTRSSVMNESKRVMKKDGRIFIVDYHPGPIGSLKGWFLKIFIIFIEFLAGKKHFRNYRKFLELQGMPPLIIEHQLSIEKTKIVAGGNIGLFLLKKANQ